MAERGTLSGRWVIAGDTPVYLRVAEPDSSAPAVIHLHGFAISGRYMVPTAELLAGEFRTYVPDLPGFGRSPHPEQRATIPLLADHMARILDAVGVERATMVGNSLGCAVVAAFADRHPERLDRAVLVSPAGGIHSQPLARAVAQLTRDAFREPPSMARVAVCRVFRPPTSVAAGRKTRLGEKPAPATRSTLASSIRIGRQTSGPLKRSSIRTAMSPGRVSPGSGSTNSSSAAASARASAAS